MSAVNILVYPHAAMILTDTKATTDDGIQFNVNKVAVLPWARLAIAVRGHVAALQVFERLISQNCRSYDQAVIFIAENFAKISAAEYIDPSEQFAMRQDVDLFLAGYGKLGPAACWVSNYKNSGQVRRITDCHVMPLPDREAQARFASDVTSGIANLMADQSAQHIGVGGWIVVTEIQEGTIMQYPLGGLCGLSSVASQIQPESEKAELAAIVAANAERAARLAAVTEVG